MILAGREELAGTIAGDPFGLGKLMTLLPGAPILQPPRSINSSDALPRRSDIHQSP
jgi:hypothetical protein